MRALIKSIVQFLFNPPHIELTEKEAAEINRVLRSQR